MLQFSIHTAPRFAPYDFNYAFVSSRSVSLTWKPPPTDDRSGTITRYRIQYRCQTSSTCSTRRTYYTQSLTYAVSSLLSGEEYTFDIAACVGYSCGNTESTLTVNIPSRGKMNMSTQVVIIYSYSRFVVHSLSRSLI